MKVSELHVAQPLLTSFLPDGRLLQLLVLADDRCAIAEGDEVVRTYEPSDVERATLDFVAMGRGERAVKVTLHGPTRGKAPARPPR